ncbi:hypothetical protein GCM10009677_06160 [Sphaerisporangium rubeum]|uniref:Uncharacterized protein n=1 Tax=Sphaerisporangium rubeum TaxID=321317 RepID=A0A7X0IKN9_9ACTN|nr:hypothetical protein [Sphaerisporangium rubeum]MBB6476951.1 hypothetical protein [Sphaerisporangium rubeum]
MYGWLWRVIPGGAVVKTLVTLVLAVLAMALLWKVVFPMLEPYVVVDRGVVGG